MDAHALLTSQGWRGSGHSLHASSDTIGLSRPLLVSQKQNTLGIGKKQHKTSDMWWMNAFDKSLKGLDTSKEGEVKQTVTNGGLDMVKKGGSKFVGTGGLYASFVRGTGLSGTLTPEDKEIEIIVEEQTQPVTKSRRIPGETKEERRARKAARRAERAAKSESSSEPAEQHEVEIVKEETKEERRERRRQKKLGKLRETTAVEKIAVEVSKKKKRRTEE
jgi:nucleolar protein TMA23